MNVNNNFIHELMHFINDGVLVTDLNFNIIDSNQSALILLNLPPDYQNINIKNHIKNVFQFENLETTFEQVNDFTILRPETDNFNALYLSVKIFHNNKNSTHFILIKNITEQKLQSLLQNEFLTMMSHKLRTPIVALSYAMKLVQKRKFFNFSETETDDFITQSYFKSFEIAEVVEKLIRYASVIKDKSFSKNEITDLEKIISEVIERFEIKYKTIRPNHTIDFVKPTSKVQVKFPEEYLFLVLENLLDNAVKFNLKENAFVKISFIEDSNNKLLVSIEDNGQGIPKEFHEKVFENFYQVDKFCAGTVDGVGLGLPLVKHVLNVFNESIKLESEIDKGTKISFTLSQIKN